MPKNKIKTVSNEILPHPDLPPINFRIGQTVWQANSIWTGKATQCNVCDGNRNITVNVPKSDRVVTVQCPNCYGNGHINGAYRYYLFSINNYIRYYKNINKKMYNRNK